jgi:hypothetical protein
VSPHWTRGRDRHRAGPPPVAPAWESHAPIAPTLPPPRLTITVGRDLLRDLTSLHRPHLCRTLEPTIAVAVPTRIAGPTTTIRPPVPRAAPAEPLRPPPKIAGQARPQVLFRQHDPPTPAAASALTEPAGNRQSAPPDSNPARRLPTLPPSTPARPSYTKAPEPARPVRAFIPLPATAVHEPERNGETSAPAPPEPTPTPVLAPAAPVITGEAALPGAATASDGRAVIPPAAPTPAPVGQPQVPAPPAARPTPSAPSTPARPPTPPTTIEPVMLQRRPHGSRMPDPSADVGRPGPPIEPTAHRSEPAVPEVARAPWLPPTEPMPAREAPAPLRRPNHDTPVPVIARTVSPRDDRPPPAPAGRLREGSDMTDRSVRSHPAATDYSASSSVSSHLDPASGTDPPVPTHASGLLHTSPADELPPAAVPSGPPPARTHVPSPPSRRPSPAPPVPVLRSPVPANATTIELALAPDGPAGFPAPEPTISTGPDLLPATRPPPDPPNPPGPATPTASTTGRAGGADLDELAHQLYDHIRWRLRAELRLDRERSGDAAGLRR